MKKTISLFYANLFGVIFFLLVALICLPFFDAKVGLKNATLFNNDWEIVLFVLVFILSIFVHEFLHAITFAFFAKKGWKSVKIGVLWNKATPYAHCTEPLKRNEYALAVILPFIVLGLAPIIWSFIQSNLLYLIYGIIMSTAAGGDILIMILLFQVSKNVNVQDHEKECGFWIIPQ